MDAPEPKRRWYCPAPSWLVFGSLAVTGLLFASERWRWFPFNEHKGWTVLIAVAGAGAVLVAMGLWFVMALVFRLRFQFSIRSLLVLVVAVALPLSWLSLEMKKAHRQGEAVRVISGSGPGVIPDFSAVDFRSWIEFQAFLLESPPRPPWPLNLLGDDLFTPITFAFGDRATDDALRSLKELDQLQALSLSNASVTDAGMEHLGALHRLRWLFLDGTKVTDEGVKQLQQALPNCKILR